ncbi:glycosyltransferase family 4 protein [Kyrpidia spormannii]|uniref:Glycosyltransferase n=2 Tax=Kyrpidia spormannii TaxID=2055160 RepID=A0ACA8Z5I1_9BACL|nr:glycosyltransferase family 4 protein [Kyrpidia spormannii]CAB3389562.1 putative Glycosyltransferase [Kyrpidia spormannii]CAB3390414.1 putative Glycosyltransferase [Kyrpidia spormannii]
MKQKVAHFYPILQPGGGPAGYLYNLYQALEGKDSPIELIYDGLLDESEPPNMKMRRYQELLNKFPTLAALLAWAVIPMRRRFGKILSEDILLKIGEYAVVVFHDVFTAYEYLRKRKSTQKIFIMTHSPTDFVEEYVCGLSLIYRDSLLWENLYKQLAEMELEVYQAVDGIIAPCKASLEGYYAKHQTLRRRFEACAKKLYEIPSGVKPLQVTRSKEDILKSLSLNSNIILIGYFGRYHPHKGFDIFLEVARLAAKAYPKRFYFISGGRGPLVPPSLEGYKDLGWLGREEVANLMNAVDIVMVPNRVTFFDLLILEAMSLGKPVLTSLTGGNKCMQRFSKGIITIDSPTPDAYLTAILEGVGWDELGEENRQAYVTHFTPEAFLERHVKLTQVLLSSFQEGIYD